jgi:hypothetical protein
MQAHQTTDAAAWSQYAGAWNAVAWRFMECADHSDAFIASINQHGVTPTPEPRYAQEKELFGFFGAGLSTLESLCFALWAMAHILVPAQFPIGPADLRAVGRSSARTRYLANWPTEDIATRLDSAMASAEFIEWNEIRNILVHRAAGARHTQANPIVHVATRASSATGPMAGSTLWLQGLPIDTTLTSVRRTWLSTTLHSLLEAAERFAAGRL